MTDSIDFAGLRKYDTPTICNALEHLSQDYRTSGFTSTPFVCFDPSLPPIVGFARTATIRAAAAQTGSPADIAVRRVGYYDYIAAGTAAGPTVVVIQDLDPEPGFGAYWGEVNTHIHRGLGVLGVVTNGSIRDLDDSASNFQLLAGKVGPSHAWVHAVDWGDQINVHGMTVGEGDLIHADRHGAVVIPTALANQVPAAAELLGRREKVILDAARSDDFSIEKLRAALARSGEIH